MSEEFDLASQPFNPRVMETFTDFIRRQKEETVTHKGKKVKCIGCGDCCTWNFYKVQVSPKVIKDLKVHEQDPHGYWIMGDHILHFYQVFFDEPNYANPPEKFPVAENCKFMHFAGPIGDDYYQFQKEGNRRHGYWVVAPDNWIVLYSVNKCQHVTADMKCGIYETRPKVCRGYYCGRYLDE